MATVPSGPCVTCGKNNKNYVSQYPCPDVEESVLVPTCLECGETYWDTESCMAAQLILLKSESKTLFLVSGKAP